MLWRHQCVLLSFPVVPECPAHNLSSFYLVAGYFVTSMSLMTAEKVAGQRLGSETDLTSGLDPQEEPALADRWTATTTEAHGWLKCKALKGYRLVLLPGDTLWRP